MRNPWFVAVAAAAPLLLVAAASYGQSKPAHRHEPATSEYGRDVITVVTNGRHGPAPTANCVVWANAEDLGLGPAQLGGLHGVNMNINPHPLPNESGSPTSFASGLAELKSRIPTTPRWLLTTLEKNAARIEAACSQDHPTPFEIHRITRADQR
jgi:hypothetical protein